MAVVAVREATLDDLDTIQALYHDLHDGDEPGDPVARVSARQAVAIHPGVHLYLVEADGEPVSSCVLFVLPNLSRGARPFGLIENVVTRWDARNRGYATALLNHVLDRAWADGCYKVMLLTGRTDPAVFRLYEKVGFLRGRKTGLVAFPPGP